MTAILGISAFYHDSAAALVVDGEIIAAAQEERFTRNKHDAQFPQHAVDFCLRQAGVSPEQLDYVGFYDKPLNKFDRLLETYLAFAPSGYRSFRQAIPRWLKQKLYLPREMSAGLRGQYSGRYVFTDHHESHAASAFFPSPFEEAAILTIDGVGEWSTACLGVGQGNKIELTDEIRFPHSLGLLYSAFTYYCGFRVNSGEYKLMGLAPYGEPIFKDSILDHLLDLKQDGSFRMDMSYFNYCQGCTMTSRKFHELFGGLPRAPESPIDQRHMDLAASIQLVAEEIMLRMANHVYERTGMQHLVLAGGVALNCVANGRILRAGPFENIWVQPAAGDAGGALGTALFIWHQLLDRPRVARAGDAQLGSLLGPQFSDEECHAVIQRSQSSCRVCSSDEQLCETVAELIAQGLVVGWFQNRMEFGPRALGSRSILGDARSQVMQSLMNRKIKFRESFRPFAPIVLRDQVDRYFETRPGEDSPYMLVVMPVRQELRIEPDDDFKRGFGLDSLTLCRSSIPAVTHVDYSARVQTVDPVRNPLLHRLLERFFAVTGCPLMINTSFNVRGEPIVCTPDDAFRCFLMTDMDALVMGHHVVLKSDQSRQSAPLEREQYLAQFQLD